MTRQDIEIKTEDGTAKARLFRPAAPAKAGVILYMLEQISDPGASGALVTMGSDAGSTTDIKTALSRYAENSE